MCSINEIEISIVLILVLATMLSCIWVWGSVFATSNANSRGDDVNARCNDPYRRHEVTSRAWLGSRTFF